jgi:hypothetical protein
MFFDTRNELGNSGLITKIVPFTRDNLQHSASVFTIWTEQELNLIDIYYANDVTPVLTQYENKLTTFTATLNNGQYDIVFDVEEDSFNVMVAKKKNKVIELFKNKMQIVKNGYEQEDIDSWSNQEKEARAYVADNTAITIILDGISLKRSIDKSLLAAKIIEKADIYKKIYGEAGGEKTALNDAIDAVKLTDYASIDLAKAALDAIII